MGARFYIDEKGQVQEVQGTGQENAQVVNQQVPVNAPDVNPVGDVWQAGRQIIDQSPLAVKNLSAPPVPATAPSSAGEKLMNLLKIFDSMFGISRLAPQGLNGMSTGNATVDKVLEVVQYPGQVIMNNPLVQATVGNLMKTPPAMVFNVMPALLNHMEKSKLMKAARDAQIYKYIQSLPTEMQQSKVQELSKVDQGLPARLALLNQEFGGISYERDKKGNLIHKDQINHFVNRINELYTLDQKTPGFINTLVTGQPLGDKALEEQNAVLRSVGAPEIDSSLTTSTGAIANQLNDPLRKISGTIPGQTGVKEITGLTKAKEINPDKAAMLGGTGEIVNFLAGGKAMHGITGPLVKGAKSAIFEAQPEAVKLKARIKQADQAIAQRDALKNAGLANALKTVADTNMQIRALAQRRAVYEKEMNDPDVGKSVRGAIDGIDKQLMELAKKQMESQRVIDQQAPVAESAAEMAPPAAAPEVPEQGALRAGLVPRPELAGKGPLSQKPVLERPGIVSQAETPVEAIPEMPVAGTLGEFLDQVSKEPNVPVAEPEKITVEEAPVNVAETPEELAIEKPAEVASGPIIAAEPVTPVPELPKVSKRPARVRVKGAGKGKEPTTIISPDHPLNQYRSNGFRDFFKSPTQSETRSEEWNAHRQYAKDYLSFPDPVKVLIMKSTSAPQGTERINPDIASQVKSELLKDNNLDTHVTILNPGEQGPQGAVIRWNESEVKNIIKGNENLLQKNGIPADPEGFVKSLINHSQSDWFRVNPNLTEPEFNQLTQVIAEAFGNKGKTASYSDFKSKVKVAPTKSSSVNPSATSTPAATTGKAQIKRAIKTSMENKQKASVPAKSGVTIDDIKPNLAKANTVYNDLAATQGIPVKDMIDVAKSWIAQSEKNLERWKGKALNAEDRERVQDEIDTIEGAKQFIANPKLTGKVSVGEGQKKNLGEETEQRKVDRIIDDNVEMNAGFPWPKANGRSPDNLGPVEMLNEKMVEEQFGKGPAPDPTLQDIENLGALGKLLRYSVFSWTRTMSLARPLIGKWKGGLSQEGQKIYLAGADTGRLSRLHDVLEGRLVADSQKRYRASLKGADEETQRKAYSILTRADSGQDMTGMINGQDGWDWAMDQAVGDQPLTELLDRIKTVQEYERGILTNLATTLKLKQMMPRPGVYLHRYIDSSRNVVNVYTADGIKIAGGYSEDLSSARMAKTIQDAKYNGAAVLLHQDYYGFKRVEKLENLKSMFEDWMQNDPEADVRVDPSRPIGKDNLDTGKAIEYSNKRELLKGELNRQGVTVDRKASNATLESQLPVGVTYDNVLQVRGIKYRLYEAIRKWGKEELLNKPNEQTKIKERIKNYDSLVTAANTMQELITPITELRTKIDPALINGISTARPGSATEVAYTLKQGATDPLYTRTVMETQLSPELQPFSDKYLTYKYGPTLSDAVSLPGAERVRSMVNTWYLQEVNKQLRVANSIPNMVRAMKQIASFTTRTGEFHPGSVKGKLASNMFSVNGQKIGMQTLNGWLATNKIMMRLSSNILQTIQWSDAIRNLGVKPVTKSLIDWTLRKIPSERWEMGRAFNFWEGADQMSIDMAGDAKAFMEGRQIFNMGRFNKGGLGAASEVWNAPGKAAAMSWGAVDGWNRFVVFNAFLEAFPQMEQPLADIMSKTDHLKDISKLDADDIRVLDKVIEAVDSSQAGMGRGSMPLGLHHPIINSAFGLFHKFDLNKIAGTLEMTAKVIGKKWMGESMANPDILDFNDKSNLSMFQANQFGRSIGLDLLTGGARQVFYVKALTGAALLLSLGITGVGNVLDSKKWKDTGMEIHPDSMEMKLKNWELEQPDGFKQLLETFHHGVLDEVTGFNLGPRLMPGAFEGTPVYSIISAFLPLMSQSTEMTAREKVFGGVIQAGAPAVLTDWVKAAAIWRATMEQQREDNVPMTPQMQFVTDKADWMLNVFGSAGLGVVNTRKRATVTNLDGLAGMYNFISQGMGFTNKATTYHQQFSRRNLEIKAEHEFQQKIWFNRMIEESRNFPDEKQKEQFITAEVIKHFGKDEPVPSGLGGSIKKGMQIQMSPEFEMYSTLRGVGAKHPAMLKSFMEGYIAEKAVSKMVDKAFQSGDTQKILDAMSIYRTFSKVMGPRAHYILNGRQDLIKKLLDQTQDFNEFEK